MALTGGCYCKQVRYEVEGAPLFKAQCHCRECQYVTGGGPNYFIMMPPTGFRYTQGEAKGFARTDIPNPVTREFCPNCGTQIITRAGGGTMIVVKVGTLDEPKEFGGPQAAIYLCDKQPFHVVPDGIGQFDKVPG